MSDVWVAHRRIRVNSLPLLGKGGEAEVFDVGGGVALKVYKSPSHPDFHGRPDEQRLASARISDRQDKLRGFPKPLPARVVAPLDLATDRSGKSVVGYTMQLVPASEPLLRFSEPAVRRTTPGGLVLDLFLDLRATVEALHRAGVIIGDFNDLNVLVRGSEARLIDADSYQFGPYACDVFTDRFVDPLLCDAEAPAPVPSKPFQANSDWYAFEVMLMQSLLCVGPYGGIYRPKDKSRSIPQAARPLKGITIFHPEVVYPKPAVPPAVLPDDLLQRFHTTFCDGRRSPIPAALLEAVRFTRCGVCGTEHARSVCPVCRPTPAAAVREAIIVRGRVTVTRLFRTPGVILFAAVQNGELRWVFHESGAFLRDGGSRFLAGELDSSLRFALQADATLVGRPGRLATLSAAGAAELVTVDGHGAWTAFDANASSRFWCDGGQLWRAGSRAASPLTGGPESIGAVLGGRTRLWVGCEFGFGFYTAGRVTRGFVFDTSRSGINDSVSLPSIGERILDATCAFTDDRAWLALATESGGRVTQHCMVIRRDGSVLATATAARGAEAWLDSAANGCASGDFFFAPTDAGVVRVEARGPSLMRTRDFPETEPFVDAGCRLLLARDGLAVVGAHEISSMKMS